MNPATKPKQESTGKSGLFRTVPSEEGCWESTKQYHREIRNAISDKLQSELCERLEDHQERLYEKIAPDTMFTAWDYLTLLKANVLLYGKELNLKDGRTAPTAVWFSSHDELVVEWATLAQRISVYFYHNEASVIITKDQPDGSVCSNDYDGLPAKDLAGELAAMWG